MRHNAVFAFAIASISSLAGAATIDHAPMGKGVELIAIQGPLVSGDEDKFSKLAVQYKAAVVALDSDGGQLVPALEIGKAIHLRGYATVVGEEKTCASACALIWVAGSKRFLIPTGRVGFHASYLESNGQKIESGVANALIGRYLTQLDLPESSIIFATSAGPDSITWLTASDQATASIPFEIVSDDSTDSREPKPSTAPVASAVTGGWRLGGLTDDGDVTFVNTDEIERSGTVVQFWEKAWWAHSVGRANRAMNLVRADCKDKSYRTLKSHYFSGETFLDSSDALNKIDYAAPDSVIAGVIEAVCTNQYYSDAISDRAAAVSRFRKNR